MKTFKDKRRTHNRPVQGELYPYTGDKAERKKMKALRHKLLFHIPLTEEEQKIVDRTGLTATSKLDSRGNVYSEGHTTNRWRYLNPKESQMLDDMCAELKKYNYKGEDNLDIYCKAWDIIKNKSK